MTEVFRLTGGGIGVMPDPADNPGSGQSDHETNTFGVA